MKRFFFETEVEDPGCNFIAQEGAEIATITNHSDWCGDTESGFGATVSIEITRDDAKRLAHTLLEWVNS